MKRLEENFLLFSIFMYLSFIIFIPIFLSEEWWKIFCMWWGPSDEDKKNSRGSLSLNK